MPTHMQTADDHAPPAPDFAGAEAQIAAEKEILGALARQRDAAAIERLAVNAVKAIEAEGRPVSVVAHLAALRLCDEDLPERRRSRGAERAAGAGVGPERHLPGVRRARGAPGAGRPPDGAGR
jgi:hypothetical protein